MQCHRIEELLELLQPAWIKEQDLSLVQFVAKLAEEAGFEGSLSELTDDMLKNTAPTPANYDKQVVMDKPFWAENGQAAQERWDAFMQ